MIYIYLLASKRFYKPLVLVCKSRDFNKLSKELIINDPHIKIVKFIDVDMAEQGGEKSKYQLTLDEIDKFLIENCAFQFDAKGNQKHFKIIMMSCK